MSTAFDESVENVFLYVEQALENADCDFETFENRLHIYVDGVEIILSRQTALKELWLACPLGGFHFKLISDTWQTQKGECLYPLLSQVLKELTGEVITFEKSQNQ